MHAATLLQPLKTKPCGSVHYIKLGDSRLRTMASVAGLWDAESIIFNRRRSVASWTLHGYAVA